MGNYVQQLPPNYASFQSQSGVHAHRSTSTRCSCACVRAVRSLVVVVMCRMVASLSNQLTQSTQPNGPASPGGPNAGAESGVPASQGGVDTALAVQAVRLSVDTYWLHECRSVKRRSMYVLLCIYLALRTRRLMSAVATAVNGDADHWHVCFTLGTSVPRCRSVLGGGGGGR